MPVAAIRGATTLDSDTRDEVVARTQELVKRVMDVNELEPDDVISMLFTASQDVRSEFPAAAVRALGFGDVPLLCALELAVEGSMPRCIRLMMHVEGERDRRSYSHVYLHGAVALRPDLVAGGG